MTDHAAKASAWRKADAKRWLVYQDGAGLMHMVEAVAGANGVCAPAAKASVCG